MHTIIKRQNIYEQVVEYLKQHIIENALRPGDPLPTEIELATKLRVSRQSVREAVKVLESVGIVETRPRSGSRLRKATPQHMTEHLWFMFTMAGVTYEEMAVSRALIECAALPLAARHAEESDFTAMEAAIAQMRDSQNDIAAHVQADAEFHAALFTATKNRVMMGFGMMLHEFFNRMLTEKEPSSSPELKQKAIVEHEQICQALRNKDFQTAQTIMKAHLSVYAGQETLALL